MALDLELDPLTNDLAYEAGDLSTVIELAEVTQSVGIAYRTGLGEWPFDTDAGLDYIGTIRAKGVPDAIKVAEFRRVGARVEGVTQVREVELTDDPDSRDLTVDIALSTIYGPTGLII
jgi:hypothetical protein